MPWLSQWLGGSTLNAALGTCALALVSPTLGAIVVFMRCLKFGLHDALLVASMGAGSASLLAIPASAVFDGIAAPDTLLMVSAAMFGAAVVLALWQLRVGSLILTLQSTLLLAILAIFGLYVLGVMPEELWGAEMDAMQRSLKAAGYGNAELAVASQLAPIMHGFGVGTYWFVVVWIASFGTGLNNLLSEEIKFGRFSEMRLGKVLAAIMVAVCVALPVLPLPAILAVALFLFVAFIVPGVALAHWVVWKRGHSSALVLLVYAALLVPVFNALAVITYAVIGYIDAWFDIRSRIARTTG